MIKNSLEKDKASIHLGPVIHIDYMLFFIVLIVIENNLSMLDISVNDQQKEINLIISSHDNVGAIFVNCL